VVVNLRHDAALADVCFSTPACGWAVGDRGVIWHTTDSGKTWQQQQSNVTCRLTSICFLDDKQGWAVGGECRPYADATRGVVLRTADGGATWTSLPKLVLPLPHRVVFFDANRGMVFGECTPFYPSGVFATHDGGNTWEPLSADQSGGWLAGDFLQPNVAALAGAGGRIATLVRNEVTHSPLAAPSRRSFHALRLVEPTGGWLVGDGGAVLTTSDAGRSWQTPPTDLPAVIAAHFDFHAVAVRGSHVWIAGTPGTRIFHSADSGKNWHAADTGQTAPLRALTFVDDEHGWAVGALGNILATRDGGQTWQLQRAGGNRAALLALFTDAKDVPLELIAENAAAEGYIAAVDILFSSASVESPLAEVAAATGSLHTRDAMLLAGASAVDIAWRFPLPPDDLALEPADLLAALNRENDGRAIPQLESYLVRELRTWRPEVVVIPHSGAPDAPGGGRDAPEIARRTALAILAEQLVTKAITAAADPAQFTDLASTAGLAPWQVKKVYGILPAGLHGDDVLATARFSAWLGASLVDFVAPARALLYSTHTPPPDSYELKLLANNTGQPSTGRGIFAGIPLAPGSDARRPQAALPENDLDGIRQIATRHKHLQALLKRTEGNAAWAAQVASMIDGLPAHIGAQLLSQLANGYRSKGQLDLAADTYFLLARRFPDHALADQSLVWLVQFYASGETAQRLKVGTSKQLNVTARPLRSTVGELVVGEPIGEPAVAGGSAVSQASAIEPLSAATPAVGLSPDDRLHRARQLADYLKTARPALYAEPTVRFAEVAAERKLGFANPAKRYFLSLRELPEADPWRECAATEEWLAAPADQPPPKTLATCRQAADHPHLDGFLDEPFWKNADKLRLRNDVFSPPRFEEGKGEGPHEKRDRAEVCFSYDKEFLYLAIRCPRTPVPQPPAPNSPSPRPRDAGLSQHDRVALRFDVDRDFSTAFELTVDERGWTHDACWGDPTWDPDWFVAAASDESSWTVEAAIPISALTSEPPTSRAVWAVAARRTIPRVGYESWTGNPAAPDTPAQYGLLIFD
jgi:photosystem II stability/assembly factor-like uncharacterized protein